MRIEIATAATPQLVEAMHRLLPQLSPSVALPSAASVEQLIDSETTTLFVACEDGQIVGMLTLVVYAIPSNPRKAWIEDVVTDACVRGKGIGSRLVIAALEHARKLGITKIDLTSNNERQSAQALYRKLGFEERNTVVFRYLNSYQ